MAAIEQDNGLRLYSYWRSSAAYRVRIGLNIKGLEYDTIPVHLVRDGGQQHTPQYRQTNPQQLVPVLAHGRHMLRQSLAILEYLDETWPQPPLLPADPGERQWQRALAQLVACDIHPLNNLRVLQYLEREWQLPQPQREAWVRHWIEQGFAAAEQLLAERPESDMFCGGQQPGLADCALIPQVYNARRFGVDMRPYPRIERIEQACLSLPAFDAATPEKQPDAPVA